MVLIIAVAVIAFVGIAVAGIRLTRGMQTSLHYRRNRSALKPDPGKLETIPGSEDVCLTREPPDGSNETPYR